MVVTLYPFWFIFVASFTIRTMFCAQRPDDWFMGFDLYAYKRS